MMTRAPDPVSGRSLSTMLARNGRTEMDVQELRLPVGKLSTSDVLSTSLNLAPLLSSIAWRWPLSSWRRW